MFALPILRDVDKAAGLHHLISRNLNDHPGFAGIQWISDRVFENKGPVAAFGQLRRIGRDLLEGVGIEAEIGADGRDGDRPGLILLELRPGAAFGKPVGHTLHLTLRAHEDQKLLGAFGHVALELCVPHNPPRHGEVASEQLVVGLGPAFGPDKAVLEPERRLGIGQFAPLVAEFDSRCGQLFAGGRSGFAIGVCQGWSVGVEVRGQPPRHQTGDAEQR